MYAQVEEKKRIEVGQVLILLVRKEITGDSVLRRRLTKVDEISGTDTLRKEKTINNH